MTLVVAVVGPTATGKSDLGLALAERLGGGDFERGPLHPEIARIGQQIVDSAALSAREKRTVKLVG